MADGKITAVGPASELSISSDATLVTGKVVVPGIIDGLSVAGLTGAMNKGLIKTTVNPAHVSCPSFERLMPTIAMTDL